MNNCFYKPFVFVTFKEWEHNRKTYKEKFLKEIMINETHFGLPEKKENEYEIYRGHPVRIHSTNNSCLGIVSELYEGHLDLKPSMIHEGLVNPDGTNKSFARLEKNIPQRVNFHNINCVEPLSEGYLEKLIDSINSSRSNYKKSK